MLDMQRNKSDPKDDKATAIVKEIFKAGTPPRAARRTDRGPAPERFKIEGYADWKDAVKVALRKPKPTGGWPE